MSITEFSFSVDDFQNPKTFKNAEAICTLLVRLLLLEPGTIQSHPDAGVGLISRYRYATEDAIPELRSEFQSQIDRYLPQFQGIRISVTKKKDRILIAAEIDSILYGISFDQSTSEINTDYKSLSDL